MGANHDLERDLELDQTDAKDVKGGGIVSASATVGGVGSASVDDLNTSVSAGGATVGTSNSSSGAGAGASGAGTSASARGRKPRARTRKRLK